MGLSNRFKPFLAAPSFSLKRFEKASLSSPVFEQRGGVVDAPSGFKSQKAEQAGDALVDGEDTGVEHEVRVLGGLKRG